MSAETPHTKTAPATTHKPMAKLLGELGELGKASSYVNTYSPSLIFPIERAPTRELMGIKGTPTFMGADLWTAYELSWLTLRGKPEVAIARFIIPCESTHIVESKSFKLYLNSFNASKFESKEQVKECLEKDLTKAVWTGTAPRTGVSVQILLPSEFSQYQTRELEGLSLDRMDLECSVYHPAPDLLTAAFDEQPVKEILKSDLLKSNCLVTGQPDLSLIHI